MAEILVMVLEQLSVLALVQIKENVKLVKGVTKEVEKLTSNLKGIQFALLDAEKRQVHEAAVRDWLDKLKDVSYDIDEVLDEWNTAILRSKLDEEGRGAKASFVKRVCFFIPSSWFLCLQVYQVSMRHDIACKIKELNRNLNDIATEKSKYNFNSTTRIIEQLERRKTTSFVDLSKVYGREEEVEVLIRKLLCESNDDGRRLVIIPVVGMGGIGKTTLAQLACNDSKVKGHFEKIIWICVSDLFDEIKITKAIIEALESYAPNLVEMESLLQRLRKCIWGRKFLIVLDDVWSEDATKWEPLKEALKYGVLGSRILVTTRKKEVAIMMEAENHMIPTEVLSEEVCWSILSQLAFLDRDRCEQLEAIAKQITIKCKGVPLVAKTLGSLLRFKKSRQQWENVLHSDLWELEDVQMKVFVPFLLSYGELSPIEKRCLSYCSIFPKGYIINKDDVIEMWMSQGYLNWNENLETRSRDLEKEGQDCFENLAMLSFFQDFKNDYDGNIISCKMHDIMHDFVKFLTRKECYLTEVCDLEEKTDGTNEKSRHATLLLESNSKATIPSSVCNNKKLRTLFVMLSKCSTTFNSDSLFNLTCLRTLNLHGCGLKLIPKEIGELVHLRYLNVTGNSSLREFPDTLCNLLNLQTLKMNECISIERLPKRIGNLVNLRHLHIWSCDHLMGLPKGIEKLTCLRKLDMFVVPYDNYVENDEALKLEDLNKLKHLQWSNFVVFRCGNLKNGGQAEKEELKNKPGLDDLTLVFEWPQKKFQRCREDEVILEALQPHPNLRSLEIGSYRGTAISPSWLILLTNLKKLKLYYCNYCEFLPHLGKFPCLEFLIVEHMPSVTKVGLEFLGVETDSGAAKVDQILFPKLKELCLDNLPKWKEWESKAEEEGSYLTIMPNLQSLEISYCNQLESLPNFLQKTPLQSLTIFCCEVLQERCREGVGEDWPLISHIPNIKIVHPFEVEIETCNDYSDCGTSGSDENSPANDDDEQLQEHQTV